MEQMNEGIETLVGTAAERTSYRLPGYILKKKIVWIEVDSSGNQTGNIYSTHGVAWEQISIGGAAIVSAVGVSEQIVLASAARTASVNSDDFTNTGRKGLHLIVNVSALAATPSIVVTLQGKDPISGTYYNILVATAITSTGITILKCYPGISAIVGASASDILPSTWRVSVTNADADSITYSIAAVLQA